MGSGRELTSLASAAFEKRRSGEFQRTEIDGSGFRQLMRFSLHLITDSLFHAKRAQFLGSLLPIAVFR